MPFAAALSEHPVPAHAVGEVAGEVLDRFGERPDLVMVFVTPPFAGALEDAVAAIDDILHPLVLLGCAAESIVGPHREVEHEAAVSLFAARTGPLLPWPSKHGRPRRRRAWWCTAGPRTSPSRPRPCCWWPIPSAFRPSSSWPGSSGRYPGLPVVGGMASAARRPGGNRLALGRQVRTHGGGGGAARPGRRIETVVSQGCRPFGQPLVVTRPRATSSSSWPGRRRWSGW